MQKEITQMEIITVESIPELNSIIYSVTTVTETEVYPCCNIRKPNKLLRKNVLLVIHYEIR